MTTIVRRAPGNRLAALMNAPGGISAAGAVAAADRNLEAVRETSVRAVLRLIDEMAAVCGDAARPALSKPPELYGLSNQLFGLAATVDLSLLAEAAYAFCGMMDRMRRARRWDGPPAAVYIEALRSVHGADGDCALSAQVLASLKRMAGRV
jgi:hypothetical protein